MEAPGFAKLFAQLPQLNQTQRQQLLAVLHPAAGLDRIIVLIDEIRARERRCPDCGCERCYRHGYANDLQRFRCRACGRTFNDLTGIAMCKMSTPITDDSRNGWHASMAWPRAACRTAWVGTGPLMAVE